MTIECPETPGEAIRARCLECLDGHVAQIRDCTARTPEVIPGKKCDPKGCFLWPYRNRETGIDRSRQAKPPSRCQSIKLECHNCMGFGGDRFRLVWECEADSCALWPYREGHNPAHNEFKATLRQLESLKKARSARRSTSDTPNTDCGQTTASSTGAF